MKQLGEFRAKLSKFVSKVINRFGHPRRCVSKK